LRVAHDSYFSAELIPYRAVNGAPEGTPMPRVVYNPELGRGMCEMLARVTRACGQAKWQEAEDWCRAAAEIRKLPAVYRGAINVELADAVAQYYLGVVQVGKGEVDAAVETLEECAEPLAFTMPDVSATYWLALARILIARSDAPNALWALEKCWGLNRDCRRSTSQVLVPLLEVEYTRLATM
jgi:hypothetical protein